MAAAAASSSCSKQQLQQAAGSNPAANHALNFVEFREFRMSVVFFAGGFFFSTLGEQTFPRFCVPVCTK
jgi:hypothetical protein